MVKPKNGVEQKSGHTLLAAWVEERAKSGAKISDIAQGLGLSLQQLNHLTAGRRNATITQAVSIKQRAGIPIEAWV